MSWFHIALIATLCWGFADLFYKAGADGEDKDSHLKTTIAVGFVFGIHAFHTLLFSEIDFDFRNILCYAPVSAMYILSMGIGYLGLRYLELSIVSPVENCSGALAALLGIVILRELPEGLWNWIGILLCCGGVFLLGLMERNRTEPDGAGDNSRFRRGAVAFLLPLGYCLIDTLGTFLDDPCLDMETTWLVNVTEDSIETVGNTAYELTFLAVALALCVVLRLKRKKTERKKTAPKYRLFRVVAALFETAGQLAYVNVIGGNAVVVAPMVASYCVVSVFLSRVVLREKLPFRQYAAIALTFAGIILLGIAEGING